MSFYFSSKIIAYTLYANYPDTRSGFHPFIKKTNDLDLEAAAIDFEIALANLKISALNNFQNNTDNNIDVLIEAANNAAMTADKVRHKITTISRGTCPNYFDDLYNNFMQKHNDALQDPDKRQPFIDNYSTISTEQLSAEIQSAEIQSDSIKKSSNRYKKLDSIIQKFLPFSLPFALILDVCLLPLTVVSELYSAPNISTIFSILSDGFVATAMVAFLPILALYMLGNEFKDLFKQLSNSNQYQNPSEKTSPSNIHPLSTPAGIDKYQQPDMLNSFKNERVDPYLKESRPMGQIEDCKKNNCCKFQ